MNKHRFDASSFVLAALVLGLGIYFASGGDGPERIGAIVIMGLGAAIVAGAMQRSPADTKTPVATSDSSTTPSDPTDATPNTEASARNV